MVDLVAMKFLYEQPLFQERPKENAAGCITSILCVGMQFLGQTPLTNRKLTSPPRIKIHYMLLIYLPDLFFQFQPLVSNIYINLRIASFPLTRFFCWTPYSAAFTAHLAGFKAVELTTVSKHGPFLLLIL